MPVRESVVDCLLLAGGIAGSLALCYGVYKCMKSIYTDDEQEEVQEDRSSEDEDEESKDPEEVTHRKLEKTQRKLTETQRKLDEALRSVRQLEELQRKSEENPKKPEGLLKGFFTPPTQTTEVQSWVMDLIRARSGIQGGQVQLSPYESTIAASLMDPRKLDSTWCDIAGLDEIIEELRDEVLLTVQKKHLIPAGIKWMSVPQGVLLYGPPGCGKTLIASALAKDASFPFIHVQASTLMNKWVGETEKMTSALFSFAVRLQPCIVFIDEIDSLLRSRSDNDSDTTNKFKGLFLSSWDGLGTGDNQVIVMGATNRREDIDPAFLSRMPVTFHIGPPSQPQREQILRLMLKYLNLDPSVDLADASEKAEGFSGRDLKQVCRTVLKLCLRDSEETLRPVRQSDLLKAIATMRERKG